MGETCIKCNNPLEDGSEVCDICGAIALGPDEPFLAYHPILRRLRELGIGLLTLMLGLALGAAVIFIIQLNHSSASAQPVNGGGPFIQGGPALTGTPQFAPAIVGTAAANAPDSAFTPLPTVVPLNARDQLAQALRNMAALQSYQASGTLAEGSAAYGLDAAVASGNASITLSSAGAMPGPQFRAVISGFTLYTSSDQGQNWQTDTTDGAIAHIALSSLWSGFDANAISAPDAVRNLGSDQIGDTATTHLQADFATILRAHSLLRTAGLGSYSGTVDIWVSNSDTTLRRLTANISDGKDSYKVDITFSNLNGNVKVGLPANTKLW